MKKLKDILFLFLRFLSWILPFGFILGIILGVANIKNIVISIITTFIFIMIGFGLFTVFNSSAVIVLSLEDGNLIDMDDSLINYDKLNLNVDMPGGKFGRINMDLSKLPSIAEVPLETNAYNYNSRLQRMELYYLIMEICDREEITLEPYMLASVIANECSGSLRIPESASIFNYISTPKPDEHTSTGLTQFTLPTWQGQGRGFISKLEDADITSDEQVFTFDESRALDSNIGGYNTIEVDIDKNRPSRVYIPDSLYSTASKFSIDMANQEKEKITYGYFNQLFSEGKITEDALKELKYTTAAHIYNSYHKECCGDWLSSAYSQLIFDKGLISWNPKNFYGPNYKGIATEWYGEDGVGYGSNNLMEKLGPTVWSRYSDGKSTLNSTVSDLQNKLKSSNKNHALIAHRYAYWNLNVGKWMWQSLEKEAQEISNWQISMGYITASENLITIGTPGSRLNLVSLAISGIGKVKYSLTGTKKTEYSLNIDEIAPYGIDCSGYMIWTYGKTFGKTVFIMSTSQMVAAANDGNFKLIKNTFKSYEFWSYDIRPGDMIVSSSAQLGTTYGHVGMFAGYVSSGDNLIPIIVHSTGADVKQQGIYQAKDGTALSPWTLFVSDPVFKTNNDYLAIHADDSGYVGFSQTLIVRPNNITFSDETDFSDLRNFTFRSVNELVDYYTGTR